MFFSRKTFDFISSVGIMFVGVVLLIVGSITIRKVTGYTILPSSLADFFSNKKTVTNNFEPKQLPVSKPTLPLPRSDEQFPQILTASAVIVVDDTTDTTLLAKNSDIIRPLASITKLMSILVLEDLVADWSSTTTILASDMVADEHHVKIGEIYALKDLRNIGLVGSSNTAINTLVRTSGTSAEEFIDLMNFKAQKLRLSSMYFVEPTGLDSKNIGSAFDTARLLKIALLNENIHSSLGMGEYYARPLNKKTRRIWSTNWLINRWVPHSFLDGHVVGKTGYIKDAGYNFAVRIKDIHNHTIRVVILGSQSNETRFTEARDVANWIFSNYLWPDQEEYHRLVK